MKDSAKKVKLDKGIKIPAGTTRNFDDNAIH